MHAYGASAPSDKATWEACHQVNDSLCASADVKACSMACWSMVALGGNACLVVLTIVRRLVSKQSCAAPAYFDLWRTRVTKCAAHTVLCDITQGFPTRPADGSNTSAMRAHTWSYVGKCSGGS